MSLKMNEITAEEFDAIDPIWRVVIHDHPRKYGAIDLPGGAGSFGVCWRSDVINPVILKDSSGVWIGVDERLACVAYDGNILFSIGLTSTFLDAVTNVHGFFALCQTEVIVVNKDFSIRGLFHLPEIADTVDVGEAELTVTCIDGTVQSFRY